jgi:hypothetical protein
VDHHLIVGVKTIFANVSLLAVQCHSVGNQIGGLEMTLAEGARIERRLRLGWAGWTGSSVEAGMQADFQWKVQRLSTNQTG